MLANKMFYALPEYRSGLMYHFELSSIKLYHKEAIEEEQSVQNDEAGGREQNTVRHDALHCRTGPCPMPILQEWLKLELQSNINVGPPDICSAR